MNLIVAFPECFLGLGLVATFILNLFRSEEKGALKASPALILTTAILCFLANTSCPESAFNGLFISNENTSILKVTFLIFTAACALLNSNRKQDILFGIIALGICITVSFGDLLILLLGIEIIFLSLYALLYLEKQASNEPEKISLSPFLATAALGFASLCIGIAFTFFEVSPLFAGAFIIVGLLIKMGSAPFQTWIRAVYKDTASSTAALFSNVLSFLLLFVLFRLLYENFLELESVYEPVLLIVAIITLALNSLMALKAENAKLFLAHACLVNLGMALSLFGMGITPRTYTVLLFFFILQAPIGIGLFASLGRFSLLSEVKGMASIAPKSTFLVIVLILSLAGVPPFSTFLSKYLLLQEMVLSSHYLPALFVILGTVFAVAYCVKIVESMFLGNENDEAEKPCTPVFMVTILCVLSALFLTFFSYELLNICKMASEALIQK